MLGNDGMWSGALHMGSHAADNVWLDAYIIVYTCILCAPYMELSHALYTVCIHTVVSLDCQIGLLITCAALEL